MNNTQPEQDKTAQPEATQNADVLFYVLSTTEPQAREAFLSKLLNTIWKQQRLCDVRFANLQDAQRYDLTLWDAKPQSFIHHGVENNVKAPIQLFGEDVQPKCKDVLINLHPEFPTIHSQYQRTIEILDQSDYLIKMGRERWKTYKQAGIEPTIHKI
ncbi:DNA polymerase III subunit chi [Thiomicrorhabdus sp.]|uniref:DNA polymerase III subunit chi n=1 Tax=Thiomicrorhabdus sp. TaxID=2039724 RepID=UPI002AA7B955|nr:DNA polymerase III subunit chi [Thiomicrorhabdus sp.]